MASGHRRENACAQIFDIAARPSAISCPIVYSEAYNMSYPGMSHAFDTEKYRHIYQSLKESSLFTDDEIFAPPEISRQQLLEFHTRAYLDSLRSPETVSKITEMEQLKQLTSAQIDAALLSKLRTQTAGTILAARLALDRKWSINLGGGFHHCSSGSGGGFCFYADISGALKALYKEKLIKRAVIIDLDAHQGNGHELDFRDTEWVQTLDVFNPLVYPRRQPSALAMRNLTAVEVVTGTADNQYFRVLTPALDAMFANFGQNKPDIIAYNAGTDCMAGDRLGQLKISAQGIIRRDELVFRKAKEANIPIFMVLSGGYQSGTARVIADSITNLNLQEIIRI